MSKWEWDKYFLGLLTVTRMEFEHWEVGFGKNMGWEMVLESSAPPTPSGPSFYLTWSKVKDGPLAK